MRAYAWAIAALLTVLAGCGADVTAPADDNAAGSSAMAADAVPEIRALMPADLDADGLPDAIPHPALQRMLVQAPLNAEFTLRRDGRSMPFSVIRHTLADGTAVHELALQEPIGAGPISLATGGYELNMLPDDRLAELRRLSVHPDTRGALTNDLADPRGVLFPGTSEVAFILGGAIPSLAEGLFLRNGAGRQVNLELSMSPQGLRAVPSAPPASGIVYTMHAGPGAKGPYAEDEGFRAPEIDFHMLCRDDGSKLPIRMLTADLNRDGEPELLTLFADGAVTALTDPDLSADVILHPAEGALDFAAGDFNGNGAMDIVLLTRSDERYELLFLFNHTRLDGTQFATQREPVELEAPIRLQCADFNRDGRADIAVLGAFGEVMLRSPRHQPTVFQALPRRALAADMVAADADADGKPDLFTLAADGTAQLSLNRDGAFGTDGMEFDTAGALRIAGGDLDGDRFADFVLSGHDSPLRIALGAVLPESHSIPLQGRDGAALGGSLLCKDVNRDSRDDVLVALEDEDGICDEIAIYLNSDESVGTPDTVLPLGARVTVFALEYWKDYIVLASSVGLLVLKVNPAEMPPTVESSVRFIDAYTPMPQIPAPLATAVADFNDNGRSDLAVLNRDGTLQIWLSGEAGEPFEPAGDPIPLGSDGTLQAIDFDRDSAPDLLYIPRDSMQRPRLLRNRRDGSFGDDGLLPTPPSLLRGAPALGDFDRDGDLDVFWPSPLGRVQFNDGRSGWRESRADLEIRDEDGMRLEFSGELACADFTGDGIDDVAAVMQLFGDETTQRIVLLEGTGSGDDVIGPFRATLTRAIKGRIFGLTPADFNGDGRLDLAVGYGPDGHEPRLTLLTLDNRRQFETFEGAPGAKGRMLDIALDDLDRDGDLDLIVSEDIPDVGPQLTLWINDGRGRFGEATEAQRSLVGAIGPFRATNLSLADFTGNGRPDLLAIDEDGNVVIVRTTLP